MTAQPLFFSPPEFIEKTAGEVDLPDDPNQWAQCILQELYKQVPYISDYQPHVEMQRLDAERGFGLGHVEIQNQTEAPGSTPQEMLQSAGVRSVRIPFVIRNKKLSPFDMLINDAGKMLPLTENRLGQALFRPQSFDVTSRTPGDQSMIGQLYPPYRQNYGFGGGGMVMNAPGGLGMGKVGSVGARLVDRVPACSVKLGHCTLLQAILPTINKADQERLASSIQEHAKYLYQMSKSACAELPEILQAIIDAKPAQLYKEGCWRSWYPPTVVQIQHVPDGYLVKSASHAMWDPITEMLDRGDVVRRYGVKVAMAVDTTGSVTMANGATAIGEEKENNLQPVTEPGLYKVMDSQGKEHLGVVVPQLLDLDGKAIPLSLFTNGTMVAVQGEIYGERSGDGVNLPSGPVGKNGAFYTVGEGGVRMTLPFELYDSYAVGTQPTVWNGVTFDGRPVEVSVQPNIVDITPVDSQRVLIPESWLWLPLDGTQTLSLVGAEEAAALHVPDKIASVQVRGDGQTFHVSGVAVTKLARAQKEWLNLDDTMFLLAGLGVNQEYGVKKLAQAAARQSPQDVLVGRIIEPSEGRIKEATVRARAVVDGLSQLKQPILLKEAASFPDPTTVDTVLSLGFINPENVLTFVSYLPDLEDVQQKLCEVLLAVRLGLKAIPQSSIERAVRSLEETIEGLKVLGFQGS